MGSWNHCLSSPDRQCQAFPVRNKTDAAGKLESTGSKAEVNWKYSKAHSRRKLSSREGRRPHSMVIMG
jgi:hypothetical protein